MNLCTPIASPPTPTTSDAGREAERLTLRIVDTLIREAYPGLGEQSIEPLPSFPGSAPDGATHVLKCRIDPHGTLLVAVRSSGFLQEWRCAGLPLYWDTAIDVRRITHFHEVGAILGAGPDGDGQTGLHALIEEFDVAVAHGVHASSIAVADRTLLPEVADTLPTWHKRMILADRLGAFVDHPFYPTARAKFGMDVDELRRFSPESMNSFRLRWLAVPNDGFARAGEALAAWPRFTDVGLSEDLAQSHVLLPIHPFQCGARLDRALAEAGIGNVAHLAPGEAWDVLPTLSVRTLVVTGQPDLHIKLPLEIATLGRLNLRAIKPGSIRDGAVIQTLLADIAAEDADIGPSLTLVDESCGGSHSGHRFLGYILRRYPAGLDADEAVPIAAFGAPVPGGGTLLLDLIDRHFDGDETAFLDAFFALLLKIHLTLWARYGVSLEANQQNSVILFGPDRRLRLLLKDNDAPRIDRSALAAANPAWASRLDALTDPRLAAATPDALAQMVVTITFQLNLGYTVELLAAATGRDPASGHRRLAQAVEARLRLLQADGADVALLRHALLDSDRQPVKYLLRAATLEGKAATGAIDVNKHYGFTGPNFLRAALS